MSRSLRWLLVCVLGAVAAAGGFWLQSARQPAVATASAAPGQDSALDAVIADLAGRPQRLDQWRGKLVVLNFWATWCPPCVEEMPELSDLHRELAPKGLGMVGIGIDSAAKIAEFARKTPVSYPLVVAGMGGTEIARRFGNQAGVLPYTVLIGAGGQVAHRLPGRVDIGRLRAMAIGLSG